MHRPEAKLFPRKFRVILRKLFDPDELVLVHIGEVLARIGGGPPDFQSHNLRRFSQTDVLLDRTGAKGTSTADGAVNRAGAVSFIFYGHVDARSDSRAIRLHADRFDRDPVVGGSGIRKHAELMRVPRRGSADRYQQVFESVVAQVGKSKGMPL